MTGELERLAVVSRIAQTINARLEVNEILDAVVEVANKILGTTRNTVFLIQPDTDMLEAVSTYGQVDSDQPRQATPFPIGEGIVGWVAQTGQPAVVARAGDDPRFVSRGGPSELAESSAVYVPLIHKDRVIGVLSARSLEPRQFTDDEVDLMVTLANQSAIAIENARLFQQIRESKEQLAQANIEKDELNLRLARERDTLNAVLDSTREGFLLVDREGRLVMANRQARAFLELRPEDCEGRPFREVEALAVARFASPHDYDRWLDELFNDPERISVLELEQIQPEPRIIQAYSAPVLNAQGEVEGRIFALRDITHEKEVDRMKTEFISTVSHELRTPLTSILGFTSLISRTFTKDVAPKITTDDRRGLRAVKRISQNLAIIESESHRLTRLINDILDIAKMEAGRIEWHMTELSIGDVVTDAVSASSAYANQRGLSIEVQVEEGLPLICGDRDRLHQVVMNLLSNAIKFTQEGGITCAVARSDDEVRVEVADTGIGIAEEDLPKVFEKFQQAGDSLTDKPTGTGLGLPICKEIIEHHRGRIWVESELGVGSRFIFTLPILEPAPELAAERPEPQPTPSPPTIPSILVVDDDRNFRALMRQELQEAGYHVLEAAEGTEAVARAREEMPDLIILDVLMPTISGLDVVSILRGDETTADIPILIISVTEQHDKALRMGADDYLTKPVDMVEVLGTVREMLSTIKRPGG